MIHNGDALWTVVGGALCRRPSRGGHRGHGDVRAGGTVHRHRRRDVAREDAPGCTIGSRVDRQHPP